MAITAAQVKELRESTGAGMMDAKKALTETDGDMDAAVDWLRTKGLAKAAKKSGRTAAEGLVAVAVEGGRAVAVEVNSETDFVAKNAEFQEMVASIARAALAADDVEALLAADLGGKTVEQTVTDKIAKIGENMSLRRMAKLEGDGRVLCPQRRRARHGQDRRAGGLHRRRRGLRPPGRDARRRRQPASLNEADLDPAVVEKEKQVQMDIARESGKPER
jgi:elongation factor Ts